MRKIVIMDIDGCISDDSHRRELWNQGRYDEYHQLSPADWPLEEGINLARRASKVATVGLVFITGRDELYRESTLQWLKTYVGDHRWTLKMRSEGDKRRSPEFKVAMLKEMGIKPEEVALAVDDRPDVIEAYREYGIGEINVRVMGIKWEEPRASVGAADVLQEMADTFKSRNALYKDNYKQVPELVKVLFPEGVPSELVTTDQWHLFELKLVKLTRFAISGLTHTDSIHDDAVYSAMIESILRNS